MTSDNGLGALIQRLKEATVGSRDLDCEVAVAVGGFFVRGEQYGKPAYCYTDADGATVSPGQAHDMLVPGYTTSLDAALRLKNKTLPEYDWTLGHTNGGLTIHAQVGPLEMAFGETPALAFVVAILEALSLSEPRS